MLIGYDFKVKGVLTKKYLYYASTRIRQRITFCFNKPLRTLYDTKGKVIQKDVCINGVFVTLLSQGKDVKVIDYK